MVYLLIEGVLAPLAGRGAARLGEVMHGEAWRGLAGHGKSEGGGRIPRLRFKRRSTVVLCACDVGPPACHQFPAALKQVSPNIDRFDGVSESMR